MKKKGMSEFIEFLDKLEPYMVENINEKNEEARVVEGLSSEDKAFAEKLLMIQQEKGYIVSGDLTDAERMKINRLCKKYGISKRQALERYLTNNKFMSSENFDARQMVSLIKEIQDIYEENYEKYNALPICLISGESRQFLFNKHYAMSTKEQVECIIKKFFSEMSEINVEEFCFDVRNNKKTEEALQKLNKHTSKILSFKDENNNIDKIFSSENKEFLSTLISDLKTARLSFDEWIRKECGVNYSRIYSLDPKSAVRHMLSQFINKFETTAHFRTNDPYLESKLKTLKNAAGIYSINDLLISLGIYPKDNTKNRPMNKIELKAREERLIYNLSSLCPSKIIPQNLRNIDRKIEDEILLLANRKGFKTVNEYLKSIGFQREIDSQIELRKSKIMLTDKDLIRYNFVSIEEIDNFELCGEQYQAKILEVENNLSNYIFMISNERTAKQRVDYSYTLNDLPNNSNKN